MNTGDNGVTAITREKERKSQYRIGKPTGNLRAAHVCCVYAYDIHIIVAAMLTVGPLFKSNAKLQV